MLNKLSEAVSNIQGQIILEFSKINKRINKISGINEEKESGLLLDIARKFYTYNEIIAFIDYLSEIGGNYFILHFSDNENYALESDIMGQTVLNATLNEDGSYTNPNTSGKFLSKEQFKNIKDYCKNKKVEFIPEINVLAHVGGIYKLSLYNNFGEFNKINSNPSLFSLESNFNDKSETEFKFTNKQNSRENISRYSEQLGDVDLFARALLDEILTYLNGDIKRLHLGADEFPFGYEYAYEHYLYLRGLGDFLLSNGITPMIWNDGVVNNYIQILPRYFQIIYWQYHGYDENQDYTELKQNKLSMPDILKRGHKVYNANDYYCYSVPKGPENIVGDANYAANDAKENWHLGKWNSNRDDETEVTDNLSGSLMAIWGEELTDGQNGTDVLNALKPHIKAIIDKTKSIKE